MSQTKLHELSQLGQSVWLDFIQRSLIQSGDLQDYVDHGVTGVTSNPAIFGKAISEGSEYDEQMEALAQDGRSPQEIYDALPWRTRVWLQTCCVPSLTGPMAAMGFSAWK